MNFKFVKDFFDWEDDGFLFQTLILLAFILLFILFLYGPCYRSSAPKPQPPAATPEEIPAPEEIPVPPAKPAYLKPAKAKEAFLASAPATPAVPDPPPTPTEVPSPVPTPPGGGFRSIAFSSNRGDGRYYQIYLMDSNGEHLERLTQSQTFDRDPHFSYNGEVIAFSSNREGENYQIFLLEVKTRAVRQLTTGEGDKTNPIWSPDNRRLIFTWHKQSEIQLGIMNADGSDIRQLTDTFGDNHAYSFSPDGNLIAYESALNSRNEIFVLDIAANKTTLLIRTDDLSSHGDPVFSPLGHKVIFTSDYVQRRVRQLYIFDLDQGEYTRLTHDDLDRDDPVFSPDATMIAYIAKWNDAWNIFVMNADATGVRNLTQSYYDHVVPTWR